MLQLDQNKEGDKRKKKTKIKHENKGANKDKKAESCREEKRGILNGSTNELMDGI